MTHPTPVASITLTRADIEALPKSPTRTWLIRQIQRAEDRLAAAGHAKPGTDAWARHIQAQAQALADAEKAARERRARATDRAHARTTGHEATHATVAELAAARAAAKAEDAAAHARIA